MNREFKVNTSEEFFDKFIELESRLGGMASLFQNEGVYISEDEVEDWLLYANNLAERVLELKKEGYYRFEKLFED